VPTFLQTVKAIGGFLDLAVKHCADARTVFALLMDLIKVPLFHRLQVV
jgi:hypothetical protein